MPDAPRPMCRVLRLNRRSHWAHFDALLFLTRYWTVSVLQAQVPVARSGSPCLAAGCDAVWDLSSGGLHPGLIVCPVVRKQRAVDQLSDPFGTPTIQTLCLTARCSHLSCSDCWQAFSPCAPKVMTMQESSASVLQQSHTKWPVLMTPYLNTSTGQL